MFGVALLTFVSLAALSEAFSRSPGLYPKVIILTIETLTSSSVATPLKCQFWSNVVFEKEISIWRQKTSYFNQIKLSTFFSGDNYVYK